MKARFAIDDVVMDLKYGCIGFIQLVFDNWEHLKETQMFLTIDPDNAGAEMDDTEILVNGDPRDEWLAVQEKPFTADQLKEPWYAVVCFTGGCIWTCESLLEASQCPN